MAKDLSLDFKRFTIMDITLYLLIGLLCWAIGIHQGKHWDKWTEEE